MSVSTLSVERLFLSSFRSYERADIRFSPKVNTLSGPNGAGKTNLLEAIAYMAWGRSPRNARDADLPTHGHGQFVIQVTYDQAAADNHISASSQLMIHYRAEQPRLLSLDGKPILPRQLYGRLLVVFFSPDDLWLLKGAPTVRRTLLDRLLIQAEPKYADTYRRYQHVLLQRNATLRSIRARRADRRLLAVWDAPLLEHGTQIIRYRARATAALSSLASRTYADLSGPRESLRCLYIPAVGVVAHPEPDAKWEYIFEEALSRQREHDLMTASTSVGPHRDDLEALISGHSARHFSSQGQQRTAVLALKFAERSYLQTVSGHLPILLVDDVLSELDPFRRRALEELLATEGQVFVTTAGIEQIDGLSHASRFCIHAGEVVPQ